jgi:RNA polymerase sigma factor (sigma-70 family)
MQTLTKTQQDFVEANHNLIYKFVNSKNIPIEEYYGVLAIGLCRAAASYKEESGAFSTFAFRCMENHLYNHWKKSQTKSAIPYDCVISYDAPRTENESINLANLLSDEVLVDESVVSSLMIEYFFDKLSDKEASVLKRLLEGKTYREISEEMGCGKSNIGFIVNKIRDKWFKYNKANKYRY